MKIASLILRRLRIPFRVSFTHASAERDVTQSALVIARSEAGVTGWGEGCPRDYVTGESDASVAAFFSNHRDDIAAAITDLASLREWSQAHREDIDDNPAGWCAVELALLDLIARHEKQPVEALLNLPALSGTFVYSAVLGATAKHQFTETLHRYQQVGMRDYKVKLSGDAERDGENLAVLRSAGIAPARVRADANNAWARFDVALDYLESLDFPFTAIEEPLGPGQFDDLSRLAGALATRIVLDESIVRENQLDALPGLPGPWIVNLRISKMGGLLRSLEVASRCRDLGLALIVGAQVGETSLLTRAALIVAQAASDIVIAQEGAFGTMLLESDAMEPSLMFGADGKLDVASSRLDRSPGFGLSPISDLTERYLELTLDDPVRGG